MEARRIGTADLLCNACYFHVVCLGLAPRQDGEIPFPFAHYSGTMLSALPPVIFPNMKSGIRDAVGVVTRPYCKPILKLSGLRHEISSGMNCAFELRRKRTVSCLSMTRYFQGCLSLVGP